MKHKPTICILDDDSERCLREERALDAAIRDKGAYASGISNFGPNHLARTGLESFPAIEVEGLYFTPKSESGELSYDMLCDFLDFLAKKEIIKLI